MGWCAQALKAAKLRGGRKRRCGREALEKAIKQSIVGFKGESAPSGGFGYRGARLPTRPTCWPSVDAIEPLAPGKWAVVSPSSPKRCAAWHDARPGPRGRIQSLIAGLQSAARRCGRGAEGVLGLLAGGAGLREQPRAADHAVGFKEIIELPPGVIEDRWRLNEGEGAAQLFMGEVTHGMTGGGFATPDRASIALGVVVSMEQMRTRNDELESWQLLDAFKEAAQIKPLVRGGELVEYSAHAVFEGGADKLPRPYGAGYLLAGEAAGFALNAMVTVRGMDLAIASGWAAARAALAARAAGRLVGRHPVGLRALPGRDLRHGRHEGRSRRTAPGIENRRLFSEYPRRRGPSARGLLRGR